ncbi:hypothetical protein GA0116948_102196 [Chitinophaga costaii]|uniref:CAAX prenyl protease 2/Lysostaphin resistance protein A-like domain-containing protein n=1 Tax=Chitinophaga costaii TaxID=1335309 RepID=A0A1C4AMA8_9BACT|nr:CPBP family intramembrane glutamic endopeptidase [Chitinophaga costaii]PUZ26663.1 CPBP family intramembrane metalloprotease [Chitinophaga costaii]SCB95668.1 hypothetical protein GA0116948_102196 [Chitinophaga costaii]
MAAYLKRTTPGTQLAFLFLLCVAFLFLYFMLSAALLLHTAHVSMEQLKDHLQDANLLGYMKLAQFGYTIMVFLLPPVVLSVLTQDSPATWLGLRGPIRWRQAAWAIFALVVVTPLVGWTAQWNETWPVSESLRQAEKDADALVKSFLAGRSVGTLLVNLALIALVPAIAEELFFRAGVQKLLAQITHKKWLAVVITGVVFSAIHFEALGFIPRVILGCLLGAIYIITGRLWLSILVHFVNNGIQVGAFYLFNTGVLKSDPSVGDHVAWYSALISIMVTVVAIMMLQRVSPHPALSFMEKAETGTPENDNTQF